MTLYFLCSRKHVDNLIKYYIKQSATAKDNLYVNSVLTDQQEADKDRIKLCATWNAEEINLTLVSHKL